MFKKLIITLWFACLLNISFSQIFNEDLYKYGRALEYVSSLYVDTVNRSNLVETSIVSMLKELDPHSVYITKDEVEAMNQPLRGNFVGIGIQFNVLRDTIYVISPISGGPAEKVGIRAGDRIVSIEGENVAGVGISSSGVQDRLMGEEETKVHVKVKRKSVKELLSFTITRGKIPIYSVDASYMVNDHTAYIKINRFSMTTMQEYDKAIAELSAEKNIENIIIDLRDNGGGYFEIAIQLADRFLPEGKLITYAEGRQVPQSPSYSTAEGTCIDKNLVIMIDEGSASASEVFSGAIQDWDRGIIIGRRSFGKGLVQRPLELPDGSMMRLTVARYYTPTGRLIQKSYENGFEDYAQDLLNRYYHGELVNKDSISFPDSLKYYTLNKKRVVYGGGGIMPDIFIPMDTTKVSDYYAQLIQKGLINGFVLSYIDKERNRILNKYPEFDNFSNKFEITQNIIDELVKYAEKEGLEKDEEGLIESRSYLDLYLKALIANDLWDVSEYFEIVNTQNSGYKKAIEITENWEKYSKQILKN